MRVDCWFLVAWALFLYLFCLLSLDDPTISWMAFASSIFFLLFLFSCQKNHFCLSTFGDDGGIGWLLFFEWPLGVPLGPFPCPFFSTIQQSSRMACLASTSFCLFLLSFWQLIPTTFLLWWFIVDFYLLKMGPPSFPIFAGVPAVPARSWDGVLFLQPFPGWPATTTSTTNFSSQYSLVDLAGFIFIIVLLVLSMYQRSSNQRQCHSWWAFFLVIGLACFCCSWVFIIVNTLPSYLGCHFCSANCSLGQGVWHGMVVVGLALVIPGSRVLPAALSLQLCHSSTHPLVYFWLVE